MTRPALNRFIGRYPRLALQPDMHAAASKFTHKA